MLAGSRADINGELERQVGENVVDVVAANF
jgi:hypothetical protein